MGDQGLASYLRAATLGSVEEFAARLKANTTPAFRHQLAQLLDASIAPSELCEAKGCDLKTEVVDPWASKERGRVYVIGWQRCQREGCNLGHAEVWISPENLAHDKRQHAARAEWSRRYRKGRGIAAEVEERRLQRLLELEQMRFENELARSNTAKASQSPKRTRDEAQAFPRDYWGFAEHYR